MGSCATCKASDKVRDIMKRPELSDDTETSETVVVTYVPRDLWR
jgi:hypothetical protein